jgi:hypothetical protein
MAAAACGALRLSHFLGQFLGPESIRTHLGYGKRDSAASNDGARAKIRVHGELAPQLTESGVSNHIPRMLEGGAGMKERSEVKDIVVECGRRPHGSLHCCDELREARARCGPRAASIDQVVCVSGQAALDSIWVTLLVWRR